MFNIFGLGNTELNLPYLPLFGGRVDPNHGISLVMTGGNNQGFTPLQ